MAIRTFNNDGTGIAVMVEDVAGGYGGYKLTHASYEVDVPDSNNVIEVRTYGAGQLVEAMPAAWFEPPVCAPSQTPQTVIARRDKLPQDCGHSGSIINGQCLTCGAHLYSHNTEDWSL